MKIAAGAMSSQTTSQDTVFVFGSFTEHETRSLLEHKPIKDPQNLEDKSVPIANTDSPSQSGVEVSETQDWENLSRLYAIWDWENTTLPCDIDIDRVVSSLIELLVARKFKGMLAIEVVVGTFHSTRILDIVRFNLMAHGIPVFQACSSKKDAADALIVKRVKKWLEGCESDGLAVLISSDRFYGPICEKISQHFNMQSMLLYDGGRIGKNLIYYPSSSSLDFSSTLQLNGTLDPLNRRIRPINIGEQVAKALLLSTRKPFFPVSTISKDIVWAPFDQNTLETDWQFVPTTDTDWPFGPGPAFCDIAHHQLSEEDLNCYMIAMQSMLKDGYKHLSDLDEAVINNIEACKDLSTITRTSLGMKKLVINHLDKLFDTNDAATTTVNGLEIQHPAAKLLVLAAKAQQEQNRDGANLTISFAGELLLNAEELIRMGFNPSEITSGYTKAINKAVEILEELVESGSETMNVRNKDAVISRMRAAVASKQFGQEKIICSLVADACIQVCPNDPTNFNVDNVLVAKLLGGDLQNSCIKPGMVLEIDVVGGIKRMEKAKVAVFADGVDTTATETTGTEQLNYAETEELIKAVAELGAKVIVSGGSIGKMALHFCDNYEIMVLKISSEFDLSRFCQTAGAVPHLKLSPPSRDNLGYVDSISVDEIGGVTVTTIARNEEGGNSISTVVLCGSTDSNWDDLERAVEDGVNTYKAMCRDSRIVPGAAATEIELAQRLKDYANAETGLDKYAISKYAESFEFVPKTLADNAGLNVTGIIAALYAGHRSGNTKLGIVEGACKDVSKTKVWDLFATKLSALKYASDAACTVLRVDQIRISKPAGAEED